jgi:ParB family protein of integrating conjugative element (PFGI_1 class)
MTTKQDASLSESGHRQTPRLRQPSIEERRKLVSESLNVGNPPNNARALPEVADPKFDCQMELAVDAVKPYDRNPRRANNAKFHEIKESIRVCGIRNPLTVTRRPGDADFVVEAGGNTRLIAIQQLWVETKEPRFQKITVLFRPWQSESHVLTAHLIENEQRGELTFWDKANGVMALKAQLETEKGRALSLRELEEELKRLGLSTNRSSLSWCQFATEKLSALGAAASSLSGLDVRIIQPRLNLIKRYAEKRAGTAEAQLYAEVLNRVFEHHRDRYAQTHAVNATALCQDCEEALAEYYSEPVTRLRMVLDALEKAPDMSVESLEAKAGTDVARTGAVTTKGAVPEVAIGLPTVNSVDSSALAPEPAEGRPGGSATVARPAVSRADRSAPAVKPNEAVNSVDSSAPARFSVILTPSDLLEPVTQRVTQFAQLTGVADCLKSCEAMPCGYYMEAPQVPLDLASDKPLRHRAWWLLALISGQMHEQMIWRLPAPSHWRRVHTQESIDESELPLLIENELGGPLDWDVMLTDWLLDPVDEAAAVFSELVVLVRHIRGAVPQSFAIAGHPNPSAKEK